MDLFIEALSYLENELISAGNLYFGGQQPSVVDYGLFPYLDKVNDKIMKYTYIIMILNNKNNR